MADYLKPPEIPPGHCPAYYELPEAIQAGVSYEQWLWLSDAEKGGLVQSETEPESFDT